MAILQYVGIHLKGELMEDDNHEETSKAKESALSKDAILLYIQVGLSALLGLSAFAYPLGIDVAKEVAEYFFVGSSALFLLIGGSIAVLSKNRLVARTGEILILTILMSLGMSVAHLLQILLDSDFKPNLQVGIYETQDFTSALSSGGKIYAQLILIFCFALLIVTLIKLKPTAKNLEVRQWVAITGIFIFSVMFYFYGFIGSNFDLKDAGELFYKNNIYEAVTYLCIGALLILLAGSEKEIFWTITAIYFAGELYTSTLRLNSDIYAFLRAQQLFVLISCVLTLLAIERLFLLATGRESMGYKKLLEKMRA